VAFIAGILITLCSMLIVPAVGAAEPVVGGKQCNIYLVVDSSGSLDMKNDPSKSSDPKGYRYGALDYFFSIMPNSAGHEMGASVFSSWPQEVTALKIIQSQADKDGIKTKVESVPAAGNTDIGAALLEAVQKLVFAQQAQDKGNGKHKESWVLLFTDGLTDTGSSAGNTASEAKRDQAIALALVNDIHIAGVFLNDKHTVTENAVSQGQNPQEVFDIVRAGRGQASDHSSPKAPDGTPNNLGGYYAEITDAADIADAFNTLAHTILGGSDPTVETVPVDKEQLIPGIGVSELIFSVRYAPGVKNKVDISILNPNDKVYFNTQDNVTIRSSDVFYTANVKDPAPGTWYIHVGRSGNTPVTEEILVIPDVLISTDVTAKLEQGQSTIKLGEPFQVNAWLEKQGQRITENGKYSGYDVSLTIVNSETQESSTPLSMGSDGKGTFLVTTKLDDFSVYSAYVTFTCGENISFRSEPIMLKAENQPPELNKNVIVGSDGTLAADTYYFTWWSSGKHTVDLSKFVRDPEGDTNIFYTADSSDYVSAIVDEGSAELIVDTQKKTGVGIIHLTATDSDGKNFAFDLQLTAKDISLYWLIGILGVILILAIVVLLIRRLLLGGSIDVEFIIRVDRSPNQQIAQLAYQPQQKVPAYAFGSAFSLKDLCDKYADMVAETEIKNALKNLFNQNGKTLTQCKFKKKPGLGNFAFTQDGTDWEDGQPGGFSKTIKLADPVTLVITCPGKSIPNQSGPPTPPGQKSPW